MPSLLEPRSRWGPDSNASSPRTTAESRTSDADAKRCKAASSPRISAINALLSGSNLPAMRIDALAVGHRAGHQLRIVGRYHSRAGCESIFTDGSNRLDLLHERLDASDLLRRKSTKRREQCFEFDSDHPSKNSRERSHDKATWSAARYVVPPLGVCRAFCESKKSRQPPSCRITFEGSAAAPLELPMPQRVVLRIPDTIDGGTWF